MNTYILNVQGILWGYFCLNYLYSGGFILHIKSNNNRLKWCTLITAVLFSIQYKLIEIVVTYTVSNLARVLSVISYFIGAVGFVKLPSFVNFILFQTSLFLHVIKLLKYDNNIHVKKELHLTIKVIWVRKKIKFSLANIINLLVIMQKTEIIKRENMLCIVTKFFRNRQLKYIYLD